MSNRELREPRDDTAHLDDLPDGSGCIEIWEHLSGSSKPSSVD